MKKIITILATLALAFTVASAQSNQTGTTGKASAIASFEVNGVRLDDQALSLRQFKQTFGQPTRTITDGNETRYFIGESGFTLVDDKLVYVLLKDNRVSILGNTIPGGIKVGDRASDAKAKIKQYTTSKVTDFDNGEVKGFIVGSWDVHINFNTNSSGYITEISYGAEE